MIDENVPTEPAPEDVTTETKTTWAEREERTALAVESIARSLAELVQLVRAATFTGAHGVNEHGQKVAMSIGNVLALLTQQVTQQQTGPVIVPGAMPPPRRRG